jgi:hypothetical protein
MQIGVHKFLFILLGLTVGHLLRADPVIIPIAPAPPKQRPLPADEVMPSAMSFHDVPVGMVAHIIGVRLGQKVEVETNTMHLISGDFGQMNLIQALNEVAAKAGLAVIDEGTDGLHLVSRFSSLVKADPCFMTSVLSVAGTPTGKSTADLAAEKQREAVLKAANEKRIKLLTLRGKLLLEEPAVSVQR